MVHHNTKVNPRSSIDGHAAFTASHLPIATMGNCLPLISFNSDFHWMLATRNDSEKYMSYLLLWQNTWFVFYKGKGCWRKLIINWAISWVVLAFLVLVIRIAFIQIRCVDCCHHWTMLLCCCFLHWTWANLLCQMVLSLNHTPLGFCNGIWAVLTKRTKSAKYS